MRQKELRIGLVCYGGVSLAVYMHGVTKELWKLARASRAFHSLEEAETATGSEALYLELLRFMKSEGNLQVRVLPDIVTGASAGGINAVFLAQAIHSGQSLEPLTDLWLDSADVDRLIDPKARTWSSLGKVWAPSVVALLLSRPGNMVSQTVAPETRRRVRKKLARFVRSRWFHPPFSGPGFSEMIADALQAMADAPCGGPLLPKGHPLDLFVSATDFYGHRQTLRINSPPRIEESEHRLSFGFRSRVPESGGWPLAHLLELTMAARSTASFPGAFPPLKLAEIDDLAQARNLAWPTRGAFLARTMPAHVRAGDLDKVSLIDGSVLVNAPFSEAMKSLPGRPAVREIDRRIVYIDPCPDAPLQPGLGARVDVGFFRAILGSISSIPREQPIRDDLESIQRRSRDAEQLQRISGEMRPVVEREVARLFGRSLLLGRPTVRRLAAWSNKAQEVATTRAGYAFGAYAHTKFALILERMARLAVARSPRWSERDIGQVANALRDELQRRGIPGDERPVDWDSKRMIDFFRAFDVRYRIRRLRLLARRVSLDWEDDPGISEQERDDCRETVYAALAIYFERETGETFGSEFGAAAEDVMREPGRVLDLIAAGWNLPELDEVADGILARGLQAMPTSLRRKIMFAYLGFPFYDVAILPLLPHEGLTEFDPVKIDRISPEDAVSIRDGGSVATLRGVELYNFGAFFSRAYRENDYLWGRLHGAERMVDLLCSTCDGALPEGPYREFKRRIFIAILDEEEPRLKADRALIPGLRAEIKARFAQAAA